MRKIAHDTLTKGRHSELLAQTALLAAGWTVCEPILPEPFDLIAREPVTGEWKTIQIKSARVRDDRDGQVVVYAKKNNGQPYTCDDCDLLIGVLNNEVYMFQNRSISEYWVSEKTIKARWQYLPIELTKTEEVI